MDTTCCLSTDWVAAGGAMMWEMFSLEPLIPINYNLNATQYLSTVVDHVSYIIATVDQFFEHGNTFNRPDPLRRPIGYQFNAMLALKTSDHTSDVLKCCPKTL